MAVSWPLLHSSDLPPRAVSSAFSHERIAPYTAHSIEGLTLWTVRRGEGSTLIGFRPERHTIVGGEELFVLFRGVSTGELAELANATLYNGEGNVLRSSAATAPKDEKGEQPKPPFVQGDKLYYWRSMRGKSYLMTAPCVEGMVGPGD